jgi:nicotinamide phosphoribosyltransferase
MMKTNLLLNADSYKLSHSVQYPPNTEYVYSYVESRGGDYDKTLFFGLQAFLREYLTQPITQTEIDFAAQIAAKHGVPFYRAGWDYILEHYNGLLPVVVRAVPEGTVLPTHNVLVTIVNTDPHCYWLTSYLETALLRAIWYPTTVATRSYYAKQIIRQALEKTGDVTLLDFKLHDFGARGVSSQESAMLGGMAHLVNFKGTDTLAGVLGAMQYYDSDVCGFSIPAMEHSSVTSWGQAHEIDAYRNMLAHYAKPGALLACVSDSYDIFAACHAWGTVLKQQVIDSGAMIVIRPDSGDPATVVEQCVVILDGHFGHHVNEKGYKILNHVRLIQGDGINEPSIQSILTRLQQAGYAADNIAFGMGGGLLQQLNRDTLRFAMKCSAVQVQGVWRDVYKAPVTDKGKYSKKGLLKLIKHPDGRYETVNADAHSTLMDELVEVFRDGRIVRSINFEEVRQRSLDISAV